MLRRRLHQQRSHAGCEAEQPRQQQRAPRRRPGPQSATLAVPLPVVPTPAECAALLRTLVKHLLFQRAQIPFLYDELLRAACERQRAETEAPAGNEAGAARRRRRVPRGDRRMLKFLEKAEEAMASIDAALQAFGVPRRAFLLLGSSTAKPREAYEVVMPPGSVGPPAPAQQAQHAPAAAAAGAGAGEPTAHSSAQQQQQQPYVRPRASRQERLCQLVLRQLVVGMAELPEGTAHTVPCKLFLLLEGSNTSSIEAATSVCTPGQQLAPAQQEQQGLIDGAGGAAPSGYTIKRHFRLSMRKGVHIKLLLGRRPEEAEAAVAAAAAAGGSGVQQQQHQQKGMLPGATRTASPSDEGGGSDMECGSSSDTEEPTRHLSQLPDAEPPSQAAAEARAVAAEQTFAAASGPLPVWFLCKSVIKGLNTGSQRNGAG